MTGGEGKDSREAVHAGLVGVGVVGCVGVGLGGGLLLVSVHFESVVLGRRLIAL